MAKEEYKNHLINTKVSFMLIMPLNKLSVRLTLPNAFQMKFQFALSYFRSMIMCTWISALEMKRLENWSLRYNLLILRKAIWF